MASKTMATDHALTYFAHRGASRADIAQLCFALAGLPLTINRVAWPGFVALRDASSTAPLALPYGQLPVLSVPAVPGVRAAILGQSKAIVRYAAKKAGLYPTENDVEAAVADSVLDCFDDLGLLPAWYMAKDDAAKAAVLGDVLAGSATKVFPRLEAMLVNTTAPSAAGGAAPANAGWLAGGEKMSVADVALFANLHEFATLAHMTPPPASPAFLVDFTSLSVTRIACELLDALECPKLIEVFLRVGRMPAVAAVVSEKWGGDGASADGAPVTAYFEPTWHPEKQEEKQEGVGGLGEEGGGVREAGVGGGGGGGGEEEEGGVLSAASAAASAATVGGKKTTEYCFAIDLDGVVYRLAPGGYEVVPGAVQAIKELRAAGCRHCFLTNGTGSTEAEKARMLGEKIGFEIPAGDIVLPSTALMRALRESGHGPEAPSPRGGAMLVVASDEAQAAELMESYGYGPPGSGRWVSLEAFAEASPHLTPCKARAGGGGGGGGAGSGSGTGSIAPPEIDLVLILSEPGDWYVSMQVLVDVLRSSGGVPGAENEVDISVPLAEDAKSALSAFSTAQQPVGLLVGNPDYDYGATHSLPRLTQGAFTLCLAQLYERSVGRALKLTEYGKPTPGVYTCVEEMLQRREHEIIVGVGDNPLSDIAGANSRGAGWTSCLVRTGCYREGMDTNGAKLVCDDLLQCVRHFVGE